DAGKLTHRLDPPTGGSHPPYQSLSVLAASAAGAAAFSTAFSIMDEAAMRTAAQVKKALVWLVMPNNELMKIGS
ncbi:FAD:protein FMN transferase, partial [Neisseria sp. P0009.S005]